MLISLRLSNLEFTKLFEYMCFLLLLLLLAKKFCCYSIFLNTLLAPFSFFFSLWDSSDINVRSFVIVPQVPEVLFIFF